MFGAKAIDEIGQQKAALLLESSLNRLKLQAELRSLRTAAGSFGGLPGKAQGLLPLLVVLGSLAGFFASRSLRRPDGLLGRLTSIARLALPLYGLWKRFQKK